MAKQIDPALTIAFQGEPGAYSDLACRAAFPNMATLPCRAFEDAFQAVDEGQAGLAMIPIENSLAGRVADVHHLLPETGLHIVGEHFQRVRHQLLAPAGASLRTVKRVMSHVQALSQCREGLRALGLTPVVHPDTAGAAAEVARRNDPAEAAIASSLAGEIYGLKTLKADFEDQPHNTTRMIVLAREPIDPDPAEGIVITTFVFRVRNVPAALYKAMGGFATNGVNMSKLESYMLGGDFVATQFYSDVEGHPEQRNLRLALEELAFFARDVKILGVYRAHPYRHAARAPAAD
ncbi:MAG: prephenate dehydratase [Alphaproteobacteria bacterium]|nr:prephenate dehydratase [Alphaproteobacteria bacterium]